MWCYVKDSIIISPIKLCRKKDYVHKSSKEKKKTRNRFDAYCIKFFIILLDSTMKVSRKIRKLWSHKTVVWDIFIS